MKRIVAAALVVLVVLASVSALAGAKKIALPEYKEYTLDNGLRVFIMETREVPLVALRLLVPAGGVQDPAGKEGIANLTGRLLTKGAGGQSAEEIAEAIENAGGMLEANTGLEYTTVTGSFMADDLPLALEYMGTVVLKPDFPVDEFGRERDMVIGGIKQVKENPGSLANREFMRVLGEGHPYGRPTSGFERTVTGLTRDDIVAFHEQYYRPDGSLLAVVGDIDAKNALKLVKKALGGWKKGTGEPPSVERVAMKRFPGRKVLVIDKPDLTQSQIRIGNIAVPLNTPDYFPLQVANTILGGGFTSRLVDEIRVNRGLTYGIGSFLYQLREGGMFLIYTFTKNATLRETIDAALGIVDTLRTEPAGDEEIAKVRKYLSGLFPFDLETNADLAWWLTRLVFYNLKDSFIEDYRDNVESVGAEGIRKAAAEHFHTDDDCFILVLTNYEETKEQLAGLGEITVVSIDDIE